MIGLVAPAILQRALSFLGYGRSMPVAFKTAAADGPVSVLMKAAAAVACLVWALRPTAYVV